ASSSSVRSYCYTRLLRRLCEVWPSNGAGWVEGLMPLLEGTFRQSKVALDYLNKVQIYQYLDNLFSNVMIGGSKVTLRVRAQRDKSLHPELLFHSHATLSTKHLHYQADEELPALTHSYAETRTDLSS
ncbi:hypothetical protein L249_3851, partial [Ophiocordyceps polyrhachis-furcata BCC 54312]